MIEILDAKPEDARDINDLLAKNWIDTYPNEKEGITEQDIKDFVAGNLTEESVKARAEAVKNAGENKKFLLAKQDGVLIGECLLLDRGEDYQLKGFYVLPEHQRKGVGQMLWKEADKFFTENKDIIVRVASYNTKAINFYEKLGFVKTDKDMSSQFHKLPSGKFIREIEMILKR